MTKNLDFLPKTIITSSDPDGLNPKTKKTEKHLMHFDTRTIVWKTVSYAHAPMPVQLRHFFVIEVETQPEASTGTSESHCLCLLHSIAITSLIYWNSACWFPVYLDNTRTKQTGRRVCQLHTHTQCMCRAMLTLGLAC